MSESGTPEDRAEIAASEAVGRSRREQEKAVCGDYVIRVAVVVRRSRRRRRMCKISAALGEYSPRQTDSKRGRVRNE
jgi:uncharacterized SAM-dependent methyltransferase